MHLSDSDIILLYISESLECYRILKITYVIFRRIYYTKKKKKQNKISTFKNIYEIADTVTYRSYDVSQFKSHFY